MNLNYKLREAVCDCGRGFTKKAPNHKRCDVCRRVHMETPRKPAKGPSTQEGILDGRFQEDARTSQRA